MTPWVQEMATMTPSLISRPAVAMVRLFLTPSGASVGEGGTYLPRCTYFFCFLDRFQSMSFGCVLTYV
jgi:hypothetical protein